LSDTKKIHSVFTIQVRIKYYLFSLKERESKEEYLKDRQLLEDMTP